ncbi:MAG: UDP-N-acetylmuramate dehydrogenase [Ignavibacteriae bacterium]|nr:MAG: UDP-N-acetylmuramate dehydrogenase [Ignavibacteriota bacterium]
MISLTDIQKFLRGNIAMDVPLAKYTWMKVGGPADFYIEPADKKDLIAIIEYFRANHYLWMMLGRGSNVLVSDEGFRGAVINIENSLSGIRRENSLVVVEAGVRITKFVDFCIQNELAGVEMLAGIPGTIGGAVAMNAGAHGGEIADHLLEVEVIHNGSVQRIQKEKDSFTYRHSRFADDVVLEASFALNHGEKETLSAIRRKFILQRNETQPLEYPNLGSMFKNPANTYAAKLIEQAGLKGKRVGDAQVSEKHGNFIVNLGNAKAADIVKLIDLIKRTVYQNSGLMLELEVKMVGFSSFAKEAA